MKKEINIKIVIKENQIGSIIQKVGFEDSISSKLEVIGMLTKVLIDEQIKLNNELNVGKKYSFKEPMNNNDDAI